MSYKIDHKLRLKTHTLYNAKLHLLDLHYADLPDRDRIRATKRHINSIRKRAALPSPVRNTGPIAYVKANEEDIMLSEKDQIKAIHDKIARLLRERAVVMHIIYHEDYFNIAAGWDVDQTVKTDDAGYRLDKPFRGYNQMGFNRKGQALWDQALDYSIHIIDLFLELRLMRHPRTPGGKLVPVHDVVASIREEMSEANEFGGGDDLLEEAAQTLYYKYRNALRHTA